MFLAVFFYYQEGFGSLIWKWRREPQDVFVKKEDWSKHASSTHRLKHKSTQPTSSQRQVEFMNLSLHQVGERRMWMKDIPV